MAVADSSLKNASAVASLPGIGRALVSAGKVSQQAAEAAAGKATANRTSFITELSSAGAISALEVAETVSAMFSAPLLDLDAIDPMRLPQELLDAKISTTYRVLPLSKRGNRLTVATADPTQQEAAEQIKFTTQLGVDWIIVEADKLDRLIAQQGKSAGEAMDSYGSGDFEFGDLKPDEAPEEKDNTAASDVEDAPIVKFLHKMLLDAFNMRASDLHFEPYEHQYRVRFRIDGELREIASPPIAIKEKLASRIKVISRLDISEKRVPQDGA
jgi:type IV pilus assembly protein PilB